MKIPSKGEKGHNPDHPLFRKNTYDPKDPDEIVRENLRVAKLRAYLRHMDKVWGKGWSDV